MVLPFHYNAQFDSIPLMRKLLLPLILLLAGCSTPTPPSLSQKPNDAAPTHSTTPAPVTIEISAVKLLKEYDENEVKADAAYKGKTLIVAGKVNRVGSYFDEPLAIQIEGAMSILDVICSCDEPQRASLANLNKGQTVKVKGVNQGKGVGIVLKNCELLK